MDSFLAAVIGERWKVHLASDGAKAEDLSRISVDAVRVVSSKGEVLAAFHHGDIRIRPVFFWGNEAEASFESVTLQSYFFKRLPNFFSPIDYLTKKSIVLKPVRIISHRRGAKLLVHLMPVTCESVRVRGGMLFEDGRLSKAHCLLYLSEKPNTRLLKAIFARMTPQRDGSRKVRFVLASNAFTLYGRSGPLFRADWVPA